MSIGVEIAHIFIKLNACMILVSLCPSTGRSRTTHQIQNTTHRTPPWYSYTDAQDVISDAKRRQDQRSTYSRPSSLKRAALSTEIVGMAGGSQCEAILRRRRKMLVSQVRKTETPWQDISQV